MVQLLCSQVVRVKLERELAMHGIDIDDDSDWVLVERGYDAPPDTKAILFDAIDYIDVARMVIGGLRVAPGPARRAHRPKRQHVHGDRTPRGALPRDRAGGNRGVHADGAISGQETLQHYETAWAGIGFIRINKSQLANIVHVHEIVPWFNSRYVLRLTDGEELEVSKTYAKSLRNALKM